MSSTRTRTISTIIPACDAEETLAAAISSALAQSYRPLEVVVVDDGSVDRTAELAAGFDDRVKLIRQPNRGVAAARNAGAAASRGELLAFLDADDTWRRDKLRLQAEALEARVGAVICDVELVDGSGESLGATGSCRRLGSEFGLAEAVDLLQFPASCLMVRRELFEGLGGFDESLATAEDIDLVLRLATVSRLRAIDRPLVRGLLSEGSLSRGLFSGNRLRVLAKLRASGLRPRLAPGTLRRVQARVHKDYARDLLWNGRSRQARGQLVQAMRCRPDAEIVKLLLKSAVPHSGRTLLRRALLSARP